jgi:hypothetical protein
MCTDFVTEYPNKYSPSYIMIFRRKANERKEKEKNVKYKDKPLWIWQVPGVLIPIPDKKRYKINK